MLPMVHKDMIFHNTSNNKSAMGNKIEKNMCYKINDVCQCNHTAYSSRYVAVFLFVMVIIVQSESSPIRAKEVTSFPKEFLGSFTNADTSTHKIDVLNSTGRRDDLALPSNSQIVERDNAAVYDSVHSKEPNTHDHNDSDIKVKRDKIDAVKKIRNRNHTIVTLQNNFTDTASSHNQSNRTNFIQKYFNKNLGNNLAGGTTQLLNKQNNADGDRNFHYKIPIEQSRSRARRKKTTSDSSGSINQSPHQQIDPTKKKYTLKNAWENITPFSIRKTRSNLQLDQDKNESVKFKEKNKINANYRKNNINKSSQTTHYFQTASKENNTPMLSAPFDSNVPTNIRPNNSNNKDATSLDNAIAFDSHLINNQYEKDWLASTISKKDLHLDDDNGQSVVDISFTDTFKTKTPSAKSGALPAAPPATKVSAVAGGPAGNVPSAYKSSPIQVLLRHNFNAKEGRGFNTGGQLLTTSQSGNGQISVDDPVSPIALSMRSLNHAGGKWDASPVVTPIDKYSSLLSNYQQERRQVLVLSPSTTDTTILSNEFRYKNIDSLTDDLHLLPSNVDKSNHPTENLFNSGEVYLKSKPSNVRLDVSSILGKERPVVSSTPSDKIRHTWDVASDTIGVGKYSINSKSRTKPTGTLFHMGVSSAYTRTDRGYTDTKSQGSDSSSNLGLPIELMPIHPGGGSRFDDWEREKLEKNKLAQKKDKHSDLSNGGGDEQDRDEAEGLTSSAGRFDSLFAVINAILREKDARYLFNTYYKFGKIKQYSRDPKTENKNVLNLIDMIHQLGMVLNNNVQELSKTWVIVFHEIFCSLLKNGDKFVARMMDVNSWMNPMMGSFIYSWIVIAINNR